MSKPPKPQPQTPSPGRIEESALDGLVYLLEEAYTTTDQPDIQDAHSRLEALLPYWVGQPNTIDGLAYKLDRLKAEIGYHKDRIQELQKAIAIKEIATNTLKAFLDSYMETHNLDALQGRVAKIRRQPNPESVDIYDTDAVPPEYLVQPPPPPPRIDKAKLLDILKSGTEIPGAKIAEHSFHIRVYLPGKSSTKRLPEPEPGTGSLNPGA